MPPQQKRVSTVKGRSLLHKNDFLKTLKSCSLYPVSIMGHLHAVSFFASLCPDVSVSVLWQDFPHKRASARGPTVPPHSPFSSQHLATAQPARERNYTPFINKYPNIYSVISKAFTSFRMGIFFKKTKIYGQEIRLHKWQNRLSYWWFNPYPSYVKKNK